MAPRKIVAQTTKQGWMYVFDRVTGEPIWPITETKVLASEVPGEEAWPTQPIPSKPAPYSQQGLVESDLIDYTPAIKAAALKVAQRCRMGPYYIPGQPADGGKSGLTCSWYNPGASGGVNIDGGVAVDPETGMVYVGSQTGLSTITLQKDPCSEFNYSSPHDSCGLLGALPTPADYTPRKDLQGDGFYARAGASLLGGVSIAKPKEYGGITAYDLNGRQKWWVPNGGMVRTSRTVFAGVTLPPQGARAGADHQHEDARDLRHRPFGRRARGQADALCGRQGDGAAGGGGDPADDGDADDVQLGKQYIAFAFGRGRRRR
jgi:quinoprotein glucose dehydrogenase